MYFIAHFCRSYETMMQRFDAIYSQYASLPANRLGLLLLRVASNNACRIGHKPAV
jgi:hypothetical protein